VRLIERLAPLEHAFTHFRLRAWPLVFGLRSGGAPGAAQPERVWLALALAPQAAAPAPVKRLLAGLAATCA
jgi:A/G-specific adenine glycosylase